MVWAHPVSLAATKGIARTFFLIVMVATAKQWPQNIAEITQNYAETS